MSICFPKLYVELPKIHAALPRHAPIISKTIDITDRNCLYYKI